MFLQIILRRWTNYCLCFFLIASPSAFAAQDGGYSAKDFFSGSELPNAERRRLMRHLLGNQWVIDAEADDYFRRINNLLASNDDYLIAIADTNVVNAFAYPSGIIVMYRGILNLTRSEDEFLSIVAHEMGHIKLEHYKKQQENAANASLLSLPILIAGILTSEPDVRNALITGSSGLLNNKLYSYSRELEHEADIFGLDTMLTANRDGHAMANVFSKLSDGGRIEYLSTHPAPRRRQSYLANRLHNIPSPPPANDLSFYLLREKILINKNIPVTKLKETKRRRLANAKSERDAIVLRYGLLLLATQTRDSALGEEMSAALQQVEHPYVARAIADNLLSRKKNAEAHTVLTTAMRKYPNMASLTLDLIRLLERNKQHKQALAVYNNASDAIKERPDILQQAGKAAAYLNKRVLSNYLLASGQAKDGRFEQALKQIAVAKQFKTKDTKILIALNDLKKTLKKELKLLRNNKIGPNNSSQPTAHLQ